MSYRIECRSNGHACALVRLLWIELASGCLVVPFNVVVHQFFLLGAQRRVRFPELSRTAGLLLRGGCLRLSLLLGGCTCRQCKKDEAQTDHLNAVAHVVLRRTLRRILL